MDGETTDNVGIQMVLGGNCYKENFHTFKVGTHSSSAIDATFRLMIGQIMIVVIDLEK